ncbi:Membrane lipoprotein TmpC [Neomoorella glycerini]|uniref:Membrane lipoprotein TmpC n=1 Tax=Neomoorella glycerini TaxID=55779 RepID=A0A6I5ZUQ6_9FIRM|nr:BMP family ABC transporter substrate-binding protein [Moorella glycerini]QGP93121.1 Membrane lipoprotein TmpC [Moorella glycerini]
MKKLLVVILALFLSVAFVGCGGQTGQQGGQKGGQSTASGNQGEKKLRFVMVTDQAGVGDEGFNDMAWAGLKRAEKELGAEIKVIESSEMTQYTTNLAAGAEQGYNMVVAVGFLLVDALKEVAPRYPNTKFVIIDGVVEGPNVASVVFKENEGAYLAGALAGLTTKTNKLGYVGGMEAPPTIRFESGWLAGIKTTNPKAETSVAYVGSFNDPGKAKETALAQYNQGVDIIFEVAGLGGLGVIEAAKNSKEGNLYVAVDRDKSKIGGGRQLTAVLKRIDNAVFEIAQKVKDGTFKGGIYELGLKEGGMGLPETTKEKATPEAMAVVEKLKKMILDGQLQVPKSREEVKTFTPPSLK